MLKSVSMTECLKKDSTGGSWQDNDRLSTQHASREWWGSCDSMKIYKSQSKKKYAPAWHQMYGRSKNQTTSNHPSSNTWSQSSKSTVELNPHIKRRFSEEEAWEHLNIKKREPNRMAQEILHWGIMIRHQTGHRLGVHLISGDDRATPWKSINLNRKGNMPQYGIRCMVDQKNQTTSDHPSSNVQS